MKLAGVFGRESSLLLPVATIFGPDGPESSHRGVKRTLSREIQNMTLTDRPKRAIFGLEAQGIFKIIKFERENAFSLDADCYTIKRNILI